MGSGLVNGFIKHFYTQLVTRSNCSAIPNSHSAIHYSTHLTSFLSLLYLDWLSPGNSFHAVASSASVFTPLLTGNCLTPNSLLQPPTLLTDISRLLSNGSWPLLYSLGTDHTQNNASDSSSVVACVCCGHYLAMAIVYRAIT
jgi:hypothetical protein